MKVFPLESLVVYGTRQSNRVIFALCVGIIGSPSIPAFCGSIL